MAFSAFSTCW